MNNKNRKATTNFAELVVLFKAYDVMNTQEVSIFRFNLLVNNIKATVPRIVLWALN